MKVCSRRFIFTANNGHMIPAEIGHDAQDTVQAVFDLHAISIGVMVDIEDERAYVMDSARNEDAEHRVSTE